MSRAHETFGKKETRSKQEKKRKDKEKKRLERKENKGSSGFDDMIAYVDEFGNITSTPPDVSQRKTVNAEDIDLGMPRSAPIDPAELIREGKVTFFDTSKGYGFIRDLASRQDVFVHVNELKEPIKEDDIVNFEVVRGPKGNNARNVTLKKKESPPLP